MFYMIIKDENDREKVKRLYIKYRGMLFQIANEILNNYELAEDAIHDTFIRVIDNLHKIDENNYHKTASYLAIICRNVSINIYNSKTYLNNNPDVIDKLFDGMDPLDMVINDEAVRRLIDTIKTLPFQYSDILFLKYYHGLNYEEISKLLDINQATARKRVERAKNKLLSILEGSGFRG